MNNKSMSDIVLNILIAVFVILIITTFVFMGVYVVSDTNVDNISTSNQKEESVIHYEQCPATITDVDKIQWFATTMQRNIEVKVYCEKYDINKTFNEHYSGMMVGSLWELEKGDTVMVSVYYYVIPSTGERVSTPQISSVKRCLI